jgi:hypothetical protein
VAEQIRTREQYVDRRRARYTAQLLEAFEDLIEPLIPADKAQEFKVLVRRKLGALAADSKDVMGLEGEMNGHAQALKDSLHADSSAPSRVPTGGGN